MYMIVKHLHLTAVALSLTLFTIRFYWLQRNPAKLQLKWIKILPHAVDTLLLASAIALCVLIQQYPISTPWLTAKVLGLFCYLGMGLMALKFGRNNLMRWVGFVGGIACLGFVAKVAILKQPLLW